MPAATADETSDSFLRVAVREQQQLVAAATPWITESHAVLAIAHQETANLTRHSRIAPEVLQIVLYNLNKM